MRRTVLGSIMAVAIALVGSASAVLGNNWGAGVINPQKRCTPQPDYDSECTANNTIHYVWISAFVPDDLGNALDVSLEQDYDEPIDELYASVTTDVDLADVRVYYSQLPDSFPNAYTTCLPNATLGARRFNKWCKPQLLYYDSAEYGSCWSQSSCRKYLACHELGHTLGLAHAGVRTGDHPDPNLTCMSYAGQPDPRAHDRDHIRNCYPHPGDDPERPPACVSDD